MTEAQRQQALIAALDGVESDGQALRLREAGARLTRGLDAYRSNAAATADRALALIYPTLRTMVGTDDFCQLAQAFWRSRPPQRGDLGEWGEDFPRWLSTDPRLLGWPYLADCGRLDWALHCNERAADASLDAGSLALLASHDPARLVLQLMPGVAVLRSAWPIVTIHAAHQLAADASGPAFEAVRLALAAPQAECAFVAREGWRGVVHRLDGGGATWTDSLLAGVDLDTALTQAGSGFDFAAWLARALRGSWLRAVRLRD